MLKAKNDLFALFNSQLECGNTNGRPITECMHGNWFGSTYLGIKRKKTKSMETGRDPNVFESESHVFC